MNKRNANYDPQMTAVKIKLIILTIFKIMWEPDGTDRKKTDGQTTTKIL